MNWNRLNMIAEDDFIEQNDAISDIMYDNYFPKLTDLVSRPSPFFEKEV
jgi:hypothetical protein